MVLKSSGLPGSSIASGANQVLPPRCVWPAAEEYQASKPDHSAVCADAAAFDYGFTTAEQISSVIENNPMDKVIAIYKQLNG